jgi:polyisoprenoid-binding protein YceI
MSWKIDPAHSHIQFSIRHMMISKVRGNFDKFDGVIALDEEHPANTLVEVKIDIASVDTREPQRDAHLRSADFFNADVYPYMIFKGKRVDVLDGSHARMTGDLTIRDITREVVLDVEYEGKAKSPQGKTSVGFTGTTKISRKDWNLTWNLALETGGVLVGDDVEISIELELIQG